MKIPLILLLFLAWFGSSFGAAPPAKGRTLAKIDVIPTRVLQRSISPWFYKSLLVSPIEGWIVVRAQLAGTKLIGERVIRSDLGGAFDAVALQRAKELRIAGDKKLESQIKVSTVLLHLLIYKGADGTIALSFAALDSAGGNQLDYFGCATLAVLKEEGHWVAIKGPEGLEGKGLAVREAGPRNDLDALAKVEGLFGARSK